MLNQPSETSYWVFRNDLMFNISYYSKIYENSKFAGIFFITYQVDVISKIISPLYKEDNESET